MANYPATKSWTNFWKESATRNEAWWKIHATSNEIRTSMPTEEAFETNPIEFTVQKEGGIYNSFGTMSMLK